MTKTVRDRVITILSGVVTGICIILFGSWTDSKKNSNDKLTSRVERVEVEKADKTEVEKKLDESDFLRFKAEYDAQQAKSAAIDKEFRDWLREQMKELRQDIRSLKK